MVEYSLNDDWSKKLAKMSSNMLVVVVHEARDDHDADQVEGNGDHEVLEDAQHDGGQV